ncbi:MAG: hypothetical protein JW839_10625 [Candidatus Lokiarchaeota archaeon]|nr:hypothetical protein [Candidatus Lokiarchaeota archaeon]
MTVVKIQNKDRLDKLIARLTMRIGRKPTQQEVVDVSIRMADERFDELLSRLNQVPIIDDDKLKKILALPEELSGVPWDTSAARYAGADDAEIYGN